MKSAFEMYQAQAATSKGAKKRAKEGARPAKPMKVGKTARSISLSEKSAPRIRKNRSATLEELPQVNLAETVTIFLSAYSSF